MKTSLSKRILSLAGTCLLVAALAGCGKDDDGGGGAPVTPPNTKPVAVKITVASVNADAQSLTATIPMSFTNFDGIDYLAVYTTIDGMTQTEKILKAQLAEPYSYVCPAGSDRPNRFTVRFVAVGVSGQLSEPKTVEVLKTASTLTLALSQQTIKPAGGATSVSVDVTVSDLSKLDRILVTRRSMGAEQTTPLTGVATSPYTYIYTLGSDDSDLVTLSFAAVEKISGLRSEPAVLNVDKRAGLGFQNVKCISRITGKNDTGAGFPATQFTVENKTDERFNVGGTDLGIIWEIEPGYYGLFFGDTFGRSFRPNSVTPGPNGGDWRSNVLLYSTDTDLSDGMTLSGAAMDETNKFAREICPGGKNGSGNGDWTSIPTAAIRVNGIDYVHYMNIRNWAGWVTNYSKLYKSTDNARTWAPCTTISYGGESNFGQVGYWCKDGYVYMVGTNSGRDNKPHLARVKEANFERQTEYEFWNGTAWIRGNESAATPLIDDIAGELSVAYNEKFGKWIMLYFSGPRYDITFTSADQITGPWAAPQKIVAGQAYAQLYGSYIHPVCLKSDKLYFAMSMWFPYNAYLMCADLKKAD